MVIEYIKKCSVYEAFRCEICGQQSKSLYIATPSLPKLASWKELKCCTACAKREVGNKNKKKWEALHAKRKKETS